jgi:acyl carrier protein
MNNLKTEIKKIIRNTLKIKNKKINLVANNIQNWDSIGHLHLVTALEKKFKINFSNSEISKMLSEDYIFKIIASKKKTNF